jgi:hypothetical protein
VGRRVLEALAPHDVFASAPSWDGKWLSVLLRGAGLPRHALRLRNTDEAHLQAAMEILESVRPGADVATEAVSLVRLARTRLASAPAHRALADARHEFEVWQEVRRLSRAAADVF